jgi:hypothetical protein
MQNWESSYITGLHCATFQKTELCIATAVRTSNPAQLRHLVVSQIEIIIILKDV